MSPKLAVGMMGTSPGKGSASMATADQIKEFLEVVKSHGVKELDTARAYNKGKSEELLGEVGAREDFAISTKAPGFSPNSLKYETILSNSEKSHEALKQGKVDIYYIHGPDEATPFKDQCRAFGKLYNEGKFERFGVCNLGPSKVQIIYDICKKEGYPLPTVYQGNYNAIFRGPEEKLLPKLRELNISFYAWGPLAAGLLAKPIDDILKPKPGSKFAEMPVFGNMYLNDENVASLKRQHELCRRAGMSLMEASLRWMMHHAPLMDNDAIVLGASSSAQIDASLTASKKGPLPQELVDGFDELWKVAKDKSIKLPD